MKICQMLRNYCDNKKQTKKEKKINKHEAIMDLIEEHELLTQKANLVMDEFIAAMDGENKWFECTCVELPEKNSNLKRKLKKHDCTNTFNGLAYRHNHS